MDEFCFVQGALGKDEFIGDILTKTGVNSQQQGTIIDYLERHIDLKSLNIGSEFLLLFDRSDTYAEYFVLKPDPFRHVVVNLICPEESQVVEYPKEFRRREIGGIVESTLWEALDKSDVHPSIISSMETALGGSVDFYHTRPGDEFKLIYEEVWVNGELTSAGNLHAAWFRNDEKEHYSFYFDNGKVKGYFDKEGTSMRKFFLKAPVKFCRISSRYSTRRLHPVTKEFKPHFGTDYAAAYGTPIIAVADGVVTAATFQRGNGNFVKLRHDKIYETQYLHMSRFGKGIRKGKRVRQGQVIGYVGSTGLSTGPHVCFRFWKNGRQINHLRARIPNFTVDKKVKDKEFDKIRDEMSRRLEKIPLPSLPDLPA